MLETTPGPRIDRSHIKPVTSREELIYLLARACELEHGLACIYLFAAYYSRRTRSRTMSVRAA